MSNEFRDVRNINPDTIIDSTNMTFVAVTGFNRDWAVYAYPSQRNGADWLPERLRWIAGNGIKVPEEAAKQIFPFIGGGPYRV